MGAVSRLHRKVSRLLAPPPADNSDEMSVARTTIAEANAEIRECLADHKRLERAVKSARALAERARSQLELVGPASERARQAREADTADRQRRVQAGKLDFDSALSDAVERTEREVREAERAEAAARAVLPGLEERVRDADRELEHNGERIDSAVWRRRRAELMLELPQVRAANDVVANFARRLIALKHIGSEGRFYRVPSGSVPPECVEACKLKQEFSEAEMRLYIKPEVAYLQRLRTDPDTTLD